MQELRQPRLWLHLGGFYFSSTVLPQDDTHPDDGSPIAGQKLEFAQTSIVVNRSR